MKDDSPVDAMLEMLVDPFLVIDQVGVVISINPAACQMFGWKNEEIVGQKIDLLMGEPFRTEHDAYIQRYLDTGEARAIGKVRKVLGRRRDGRDFPAELSVSMALVNGEPRFYGIVRDMTEREAIIAKLAQIERLSAMGELAAGIAHEVNNPVNTIINCAQLLRSGEDDPALLDDIVQEGMRIAMIVRDLLDFARDRNDYFVSVDVGQTVQRVFSLVSRRIERQGIKLKLDITENLPFVDGIAHQIQQVVLNLVLNARDAVTTRPNGREINVYVGRSSARNGVSIRVRDNGCGIDPADIDRIFEPFFTKKQTGDGTGLGLAVSRGIVSDHGGIITVTSGSGDDTEFVVTLPAETAGRSADDS